MLAMKATDCSLGLRIEVLAGDDGSAMLSFEIDDDEGTALYSSYTGTFLDGKLDFPKCPNLAESEDEWQRTLNKLALKLKGLYCG